MKFSAELKVYSQKELNAHLGRAFAGKTGGESHNDRSYRSSNTATRTVLESFKQSIGALIASCIVYEASRILVPYPRFKIRTRAILSRLNAHWIAPAHYVLQQTSKPAKFKIPNVLSGHHPAVYFGALDGKWRGSSSMSRMIRMMSSEHAWFHLHLHLPQLVRA
jgi:hypothetical protein